MERIAELHHAWFMADLEFGTHQACIDWAVQRLLRDEEGDDNDIVLLAAAVDREEAMALAAVVVRRYEIPDLLDGHLIGGRAISWLHARYRSGLESIESLDRAFSRLSFALGHPDWLVMLGRNCEYTTSVQAFKAPFEQEFDYIAGLWARSSSRAEFEAHYDRAISNSHDVRGLS